MKNTAPEGVPQVMAIVRASRDGRVNLKKDVRNYLGADNGALYLDAQQEILLTTQETATSTPAEMRGNRLCLPQELVTVLRLEKGSLVAMIQRKDAIALKKMEVREREGDRAQVIDLETAYGVTRVAQTNPMPETFLPKLREQYSHLELKHDVRAFLRGRRTLEAWKARQIIGIPEATDGQLREELIRERLEAQGADGSWEGQVVLTARNLRELGHLGVRLDAEGIQKAANWLLQRPQSSVNPGMFFLTDKLVAEQARIVEKREKGGRGRFRDRKRSEMKLARTGDDTAHDPCGPRIMWPNAFALEALLPLGYEGNERVQTALRTLTHGGWCECGYQHGTASWRRTDPLTMDEIAETEERCIGEFRYGGIAGIKDLDKMDLTKKTGERMPRISHSREGGIDTFPLQMPTHQQPCELITVRAMSRVTDEKMRRLAEAHLWRFAARQHSPDGHFVGGYRHVGAYFYLQLFASYDHPASKVALMRSIPWIVDAQNEDGSWGEEPHQDAATLAVVNALVSLGDQLSPGLIP